MQIRTMRLNRAAKLLKESQLTVTEITYAVGFSDLKHFREVFREQFGLLPGEYAEQTGRRRPLRLKVQRIDFDIIHVDPAAAAGQLEGILFAGAKGNRQARPPGKMVPAASGKDVHE